MPEEPSLREVYLEALSVHRDDIALNNLALLYKARQDFPAAEALLVERPVHRDLDLSKREPRDGRTHLDTAHVARGPACMGPWQDFSFEA